MSIEYRSELSFRKKFDKLVIKFWDSLLQINKRIIESNLISLTFQVSKLNFQSNFTKLETGISCSNLFLYIEYCRKLIFCLSTYTVRDSIKVHFQRLFLVNSTLFGYLIFTTFCSAS